MTDERLTDTFITRVMPWIAVVVVASVLTPLIVRLAGGSDHTAAMAFLVVAVPGSAWIVVLSVMVGRRLGRQRQHG